MAGVPQGFHRLNFNCPEALYLSIKGAAHGSNQSISRFLIATLQEKLLSLAGDDPSVLDLPEELQVLLGKPVVQGETADHDDALDLPERLR